LIFAGEPSHAKGHQANAAVWRYNGRMANRSQMPGSQARPRAVPTYSGTALTPEELAEFIDFLEYDDASADTTDCSDYDPSND